MNARIQECELPQTVLQSRILKLGLRECFNRWSEIDFRAGIAAAVARHRKRTFRVAVMETHEVNLTVPLNGQVQFRGQRVDHGDANAVQSAGDLVCALVEFTAGMQLRHDDLGRRDAFFRMNINRNTAPVVPDRHGAVTVQRDFDLIAMTAHRFVNGVVDNLEDHMMQASAVIGVADIHARAFADGV